MVDRDGGSGLVAVQLRHLAMAAAVDWLTERRRQWPKCSGAEASGDGGGSGLVDRDCGSCLGAVELMSVATAVTVDRSTETVKVASVHWN